MTNVEISIIVMAILIPIGALVIFLPKHRKKDKSAVKSSKDSKPTNTDVAPVESKPDTVEIKYQDNVREQFNFTEVSTDDFKDYLTEKAKHTERPVRKMPDFDGGMFDDDLFDDMTFGSSRRRRQKPENKTVAQQIKELSPELKVLMIAGVLDKKDY